MPFSLLTSHSSFLPPPPFNSFFSRLPCSSVPSAATLTDDEAGEEQEEGRIVDLAAFKNRLRRRVNRDLGLTA